MSLRLAVLGAVALAIAACGRAAGPPVVVDASQVESLVYWSHDLEGRRISIDGYLSLDNGSNGKAIAMGPQLTTAPFGGGEKTVPFELQRGGGPNQFNLPVLHEESFGPGPVRILTVDIAKAAFQDSKGAAHPFADKVRVTGRLRYEYVQNYFQSDEDRRSPTGRRYKPRLTDVVLEAAPVG